MSTLAMLAVGSGTVSPYPYSFPTSAPYNVPFYSPTPTDDGTSESIHPSGLDFGPDGWNGKRFWLTTTAFANVANSQENPHIYHGDDGYVWHWPPGLTNPIDPWPGAPDNQNWYNSDSHLTYDPDADELLCTWREVWLGSQIIWGSRSADGVNWSEPAHLVTSTTTQDGGYYSTSQALVRVSASEWRLYFAAGSGTAANLRFLTATTPFGPYDNTAGSTPITYVAGVGGAATVPYHGDVIRLADGRFLALFQRGGKEWPAISTDGITFTVKAAILQTSTFHRVEQSMYKAGLALDATDPTHVHVWYTCNAARWGQRVAYTRVPLTAWTD